MNPDREPPAPCFNGWLPLHVFEFAPELRVLWGRLGPLKFQEPFLSQTISTALQSPLARLLQRATSLDELVSVAEKSPDVEPAGFIFHVTRCGSTLVSRLLAKHPDVRVLSEPQPFGVLSDDSRLSPPDRTRILRALLKAYLHDAGTKRPVIKFALRELLAWPNLLDAFPAVPRIVLHRDPVEVAVSSFDAPSPLLMLGPITQRILGAPPFAIRSLGDLTILMLSRVYAAAAELSDVPGTLTLDYKSLPGSLESSVLPHFGLTIDDELRHQFRAAGTLHAKQLDDIAFIPDSAAKQSRADQALLELIDRWIAPSHARLKTHTLPTEP